MRFALTVPGPAARFECDWPRVSVACADGRWRVETSIDDGFEDLLAAFGVVQAGERSWRSRVGGVSIELVDDAPPAPHGCELDELVEMEFEIPLADGVVGGSWHLCCDGCHFDADALGGSLIVTVPLSRRDCQEAPFEIRPIDAEHDSVVIGNVVVGRVWKGRDEESPYNMLDGMVNTVAHPYLYHPVWPALSPGSVPLADMLGETLGVETWEELEEEYQSDYLGINDEDLGVLLASLAHGLEELCGGEHEEELLDLWAGDEVEVEVEELNDASEIERAQHLLAGCMFAGSRISRAILARQGANTDIAVSLGQETARRLVEASLTHRNAFRRISGDDRFAGVYSFDVGVNRSLEVLISEMVDTGEFEEFSHDGLWAWACWAFDLGVRYQTARVGRDGLEEWASPIDLGELVDELDRLLGE